MAFWSRWRRKKRKDTGDVSELDSILSPADGSTEDSGLKGGAAEQGGKLGSQDTGMASGALEQEEILPVDKAGQKRYILDCCETIEENERQIEIVKKEYEQVTQYLTDIQIIDGISGDSRNAMLDLCKKITYLLQERNLYKNREVTISDLQVRRFDLYQDQLIDEMKKMYQNEMYQKAIESDIGHLEREKAYQRHIQQEVVEKQNALKGMAKVLAALIVSLFALFLALYYAIRVDMTYPYLGTLVLAAVFATVIFTEANKNRQEMSMAERKMSKAVSLLNRTKIKYVNNVSVIDYNRQKFGVKNAENFEVLWGEYCKAKEYERKFRENTEQLNRSNEELLAMLAEYKVADPEVWLIQTYAILDNREMVEIRHELNQRRQKLREQVEYNTEARRAMINRMKNLIIKNPERRQELMQVVRDFSKKKKE